MKEYIDAPSRATTKFEKSDLGTGGVPQGAVYRPPKNNASPSPPPHVSRDAAWKGHRLFLVRKVIASIVPEPDWPGMWRVSLPGGYLSDMVNLTRAKDAAIYLATNLSFANGTN